MDRPSTLREEIVHLHTEEHGLPPEEEVLNEIMGIAMYTRETSGVGGWGANFIAAVEQSSNPNIMDNPRAAANIMRVTRQAVQNLELTEEEHE